MRQNPREKSLFGWISNGIFPFEYLLLPDKSNSNSLNRENRSVEKSILNIYFSNELVFNSIEIKNTGQASQPEVFTVRYAFWLRNTRIF